MTTSRPATRPPLDRVSARYRGAQGREYASTHYGAASVSASLFVRLFARHLKGVDALLDFGCGSGVLLGMVEARIKAGVEVNDAIRPVARTTGAQVVARSEELDSSTFDAVISNHALEHTLQPYLELREIHRMLKPGGKLLLCLPLDDWRVQRRARPGDTDNHLYGWTPRLLGNLLTEAGFVVRSTRVIPYGLPGRFTVPLAQRLPTPLFDAVAVLVAFVLRRRQLIAVASRPAISAAEARTAPDC